MKKIKLKEKRLKVIIEHVVKQVIDKEVIDWPAIAKTIKNADSALDCELKGIVRLCTNIETGDLCEEISEKIIEQPIRMEIVIWLGMLQTFVGILSTIIDIDRSLYYELYGITRLCTEIENNGDVVPIKPVMRSVWIAGGNYLMELFGFSDDEIKKITEIGKDFKEKT